ncbi:hypothetical protein [Bifidobacterium callitrichidarum]|uniref:Uncharacterized protein n=1 Tax=Bifidobacterium callitrichidarum TaxID=2052941 RepID=A0A2U2N9E4_9BIFI|nr:hypothetical protein [Bifidobacterium callitrichidarum]PWG65624.1 hypothetical protein DF196_06740 [Bifidobacterium callitrichidarum]
MTDNEAIFKDLILAHIREQLASHFSNGDPVLVRNYVDDAGGYYDYSPIDPSSISLDDCQLIAWEDITDPTDQQPDRCACSLITLSTDGGEPFVVLLKGTSLGDMLRDWTGLDYVD